jgi:hypothetical protein
LSGARPGLIENFDDRPANYPFFKPVPGAHNDAIASNDSGKPERQDDPAPIERFDDLIHT